MNEYRVQRLKEDLTYAQQRNKQQRKQLANYKKVHEKDLKEIERLKNREKECIDHYLVQCKYASEMEDKYITANNIINELEKYLEEEKDRLAGETSAIYEDSLGKTRLVNEDIFNEIIIIQDKIKALKGNSNYEIH